MFNLRKGAISAVALVVLAVMIVASCRYRSAGPDRRSAGPSLPDGVGEWRAGEPAEHWDPETIFNYIDGHAEVYLAYGMMSCRSRRYSGPFGEPDIVLDVFETASPADAFGVFTHDQDGETVAIGQGGLFRYGWLSFWKGRYFVSVSAEDETAAAGQAVLELGRVVDETIAPAAGPPEIVNSIPSEGLVPRSVRFLRSFQILNTHLYLGGDDPFGFGPDTAAVLARYERDPGDGYLLLVEYPDAARARSAAMSFAARYLGGDGDGGPSEASDGTWFGLHLQGERVAAVLAASTAGAVTDMLDSVNRGES